MEIDFAVPEGSERSCGRCEALVHGPPGTICDACSAKEDELGWRDLVAVELREALESIPGSFRKGDVDVRRRVIRDRAVDEAMHAFRRGKSFVLFGVSGAGKTSLATDLLRRRLAEISVSKFPRTHEQATADLARVKAAATSRFARAYAIGATREWDPKMRDYRDAQLLVVDDLGLEPELYAPTLVDVVIERAEQGRQTIVTTSWNEELMDGRYGEGFRRRLEDCQEAIVCDGGSFRRTRASA